MSRIKDLIRELDKHVNIGQPTVHEDALGNPYCIGDLFIAFYNGFGGVQTCLGVVTRTTAKSIWSGCDRQKPELTVKIQEEDIAYSDRVNTLIARIGAMLDSVREDSIRYPGLGSELSK